MIREQEGEILPDLVRNLYRRRCPLPIFSKCPADTLLPLMSFHRRLHNHRVNHPKTKKESHLENYLGDRTTRPVLPTGSYVCLWSNLARASVTMLKVS